MTLQNLGVFRLIRELDEDERISENVMKLSQRTSKVAKILAEQGVLASAKECHEFLNKLQNDILSLNDWQGLYSCLVGVGVRHVLGLECTNVDEVDVRVLEHKVSKESVELLEMLDEEGREKVCALIRDADAFKEFNEFLSSSEQILLKIYTVKKECVHSGYRKKVIDLLKKYDLKLFLQELHKTLPTDVLQSLTKLDVEENFIKKLTESILSLEGNVRRPILRYLVLQLKGLEKLKKELVDECVCADNPVVFQSEVTKFLEDLKSKTIRLSKLLEKVEELRWLASELSKVAYTRSMSDVVKIIELIKDVDKAEISVSGIEELIEILLDNVTPEGKVDLVKIYEEVKKCNKQDLLDTLIRLCKEGAFECIIHIR